MVMGEKGVSAAALFIGAALIVIAVIVLHFRGSVPEGLPSASPGPTVPLGEVPSPTPVIVEELRPSAERTSVKGTVVDVNGTVLEDVSGPA